LEGWKPPQAIRLKRPCSHLNGCGFYGLLILSRRVKIQDDDASAPMKQDNLIFKRLPMENWEAWQKKIELVELQLGQVIFDIGDAITHVYFPSTSIISMTHVLLEGESIEVAMIGAEGVLGMSALMGDQKSSIRSLVLKAGHAYRIPANWMKREFEHSNPAMQLMLRFSQTLMMQVSQIAACNNHHSMEQRLSRWLMLYADRVKDQQILCTQELIAHNLGVRRERLARVASALKKKNLIDYSRGAISLVNKEALQKQVCECYWVINRSYT
jgi:CRP-like cAMP-binding protein